MGDYKASESALIKCSKCGIYAADIDGGFFVDFDENGNKRWLCPKCNHAKNLFNNNINLRIIISADGVFTK